MARRHDPSDEAAAPVLTAEPPPVIGSGYAPALNAGLQATAARVQELHAAVAAKTFDSLGRTPGLAVTTRIARGVHDAITQGAYAAVRHGGSAAFALADRAERLMADTQREPGRKERVLRGALNGVFGDSLAAAGSGLAVQMSLHDRAGPLRLSGGAPRAMRRRVCVFLHGLACDEQSWQLRNDAWAASPWARTLPAGEAPQYGALLAQELGVGALWLRYNSGLAIDDNARQFSGLIEALSSAAPQVEEWVLIGHSMGGLVARRAQALAAAAGLGWARRMPTIVCLGSPHQGAPLEKFGAAAAAALSLSSVTRPLARIADARSRGIKDLGRGLMDPGAAVASSQARVPALRLVFATLGDVAAPGSRRGIGAFVGRVLGDGLVRAGSAADDGAGGDVQRVELAGLGHMGLLNHPRVYAVIRGWLDSASSTTNKPLDPSLA